MGYSSVDFGRDHKVLREQAPGTAGTRDLPGFPGLAWREKSRKTAIL
jgi:hypothetical protein